MHWYCCLCPCWLMNWQNWQQKARYLRTSNATKMHWFLFGGYNQSALASGREWIKRTGIQSHKTMLSSIHWSSDLNAVSGLLTNSGEYSPINATRQTQTLLTLSLTPLHSYHDQYLSGETIKAKQASKQFFTNHLINIDHYHAKNSCFANIAFITSGT